MPLSKLCTVAPCSWEFNVPFSLPHRKHACDWQYSFLWYLFDHSLSLPRWNFTIQAVMIWPSSMGPSSQTAKILIPLIPLPTCVCLQKPRYLNDLFPKQMPACYLTLWRECSARFKRRKNKKIKIFNLTVSNQGRIVFPCLACNEMILALYPQKQLTTHTWGFNKIK